MAEVTDPVTAAFDKALAIANTFREKIGEKRIDSVLPGVAGDSHNCILARTFNAGGTVGYEADGYDQAKGKRVWDDDSFGFIEFYDPDHAAAFCAAVKEHDDESADLEPETDQGGSMKHRVILPSAVAQIAMDFDQNDLIEQHPGLYASLFEIEAEERDEREADALA